MCLPEKGTGVQQEKKKKKSFSHRKITGAHSADSGRTVTGKRKESKRDRESLRPRDQRQAFAVSRSQLRKRVTAAGGAKAYHLSIIRRGTDGEGKAFPSLCEFPLKFPLTKSPPYSESPTPGRMAREGAAGIRLPLSQRAVSPTDK